LLSAEQMEPSLRGYTEYVRTLPHLNEQEERALARAWRRSGDQRARNELVQSQLSFVLAVARRYQRPGAALSELVAEGNLGLLHAAERFDPERGFRFVTYARHWVRVFVSECVLRGSHCVLKSTRAMRKARRELNRATNLLGEGPDARRVVAARLGVSIDELEAMRCLLEQREVSFDSLTDEGLPPGDEAVSALHATPEQIILRRDEQSRALVAVRGALVALDARERRIATQRLMADAESQLSLKQLGAEFGVSCERARQLEARLKKKLVTALSASGKSPPRCGGMAA